MYYNPISFQDLCDTRLSFEAILTRAIIFQGLLPAAVKRRPTFCRTEARRGEWGLTVCTVTAQGEGAMGPHNQASSL